MQRLSITTMFLLICACSHQLTKNYSVDVACTEHPSDYALERKQIIEDVEQEQQQQERADYLESCQKDNPKQSSKQSSKKSLKQSSK